MPDVRKEVATMICYGDAVLDPNKWLAEETCDVAMRIPSLDQIAPQAILPLAELVAKGTSDTGRLARVLGIEEAILDEYLDALCEFKFAEWTGIGYKATPAGVEAFDAVGQRMLARELFELKRRLVELEQLRQRLNGS